MKHTLHHSLLLLVAYVSIIFMPMAAVANSWESNLRCIPVQGGGSFSSSGSYIPISLPAQGTELFPATGGKVGNQLTYRGVCANLADQNNGGVLKLNVSENVFSWVLCNFIIVVNQTLGPLYCSIQHMVKDILFVVIALFIALYGFQMIMGKAKLTASEFMTRMLKIAFVWLLVSESMVAIQHIFNFFFSLMGEGSSWVLRGALTSPAFSNDPSLAAMKAKYSNGDINSGLGFIDDVVYALVLGPFLAADSRLIGFFIALGLVFPPILMLAIYWLWNNFLIAARGMVSFMLSLTALGFLIALSPFFLAFMLFKVTHHFFESWLRFMVSFSLQVILIFAIIAIWIAATFYFIGFFNELANIVLPYQKVEITGSQGGINDNYGICPYTITKTSRGLSIACKEPYNPNACNTPVTNPPTPPSVECLQQRDRLIGLSSLPMETACPDNNPTCGQGFLYYMIYNLITLILLSYAFTGLVKAAPQIAQELAGPSYTPILGQGWGFSGNSAGMGVARVDKNQYAAQPKLPKMGMENSMGSPGKDNGSK